MTTTTTIAATTEREGPSVWVSIALAILTSAIVGAVSYGMLSGDVASLRRDVDRIEQSTASKDSVAGIDRRLDSIERKIDELISQRKPTR